MRGVLKMRMGACLRERGAASTALLSPPPLPPPRSTAEAIVQQHVDGTGNDGTIVQRALTAAKPLPADLLLAQLQAAKEAEEELPSAPVDIGQSAAPRSEWLGAAAAQASGHRLVTIGCLANGVANL